MKKDVIQQIVSHLENKCLLSEAVAVTEDNFVEKLYSNNDERKEILKAIMSLFSDDYRTDLQRAVILDTELAQKIYELEFVPKEKRLHFVVGKCTQEEQQAVYEKMFKALHFVLIAQENGLNKLSSTLLTDNLSKQGIQLSTNKIKKLQMKKFSLEQATQNLEMARKTLDNATNLMDQQKHSFEQTLQQNLEVKGNEESTLLELSSTVNSFRLMMERRIPLSSACLEDNQIDCSELTSATGELHSLLQYVADNTKPSSSENVEPKKKYDLERMLLQAGELVDNSVVSRCFSKDIDGKTNNNE